MNNLLKMAIFKKILKHLVDLFIDILLLFFFLFKKKFNTAEFKIITGSDSTHFNSLINLLKSIQRYERNIEVKIINLGMEKREIDFIYENFNFELVDFKFDKYPKFFTQRDENEKLGSYAWKPVSIYNEFHSSNKNIIWLDAGCLITKNLKMLKNVILKNGFFSPKSSDNLEKWTHQTTLRYFKVSSKYYKKRNISGGIVGLAKESEKIDLLLSEWYESSLIEHVISPTGSSRKNHRQDQAILSILLHKYKLSLITPRTHKIFGILKHQDNELIKHLQ